MDLSIIICFQLLLLMPFFQIKTAASDDDDAVALTTSAYGIRPEMVTGPAESRQRLLSQLTHSFNKQQNIDQLPTHVMVKLFPIKIQDLNEKNEVLETTIRLQITWRDQRLAWDPALYYNVSEIVVAGSLLWSPDVGVFNSVSDVYHVVHDPRFGMKVESSGRVWWHPTGIVKTYCKLHLRYFPFDKQNCKIILESPTLDLRFMNLTLRINSKPVDTIMYLGGENWDLLDVGGRNLVLKVGSKTIFTRVEFVLRVQRAKIYHMLNVILPAFFLSLIQVMFFLLPATHPQRVGSSTTTLLSIVVFHSAAVSQLPKTSTDVPLLALYIIMVTFVSGLSVGTSICVAKFAFFADRNIKVPNWLRRIPHPLYHVGLLIRQLCQNFRSSSAVVSSKNLLKTGIQKFEKAWKAEISAVDDDSLVATNKAMTRRTELIPWIESDGENKDNIKEEQMQQTALLDPPPLFTEENEPEKATTSNNKAANITSSSSAELRQDKAFLFNTWLDVSYFVDFTLMVIAIMIAFMSPLLMFGIIPRFADID